MFLCCAIAAVAMPAKPGWQTITQSDGTTLKVQTVGNAFTGTILTSDGLAVERGEDGDFYYFSSLTGITAIRAHEADQRTPGETAFINAQRDNLKKAAKPRWMPKRQNMFGVGGSNEESGVPAHGVRHIPIILVEFKDKSFKNTREEIINAMLMGNKSVGQYFRDQSNGLYEPEFDVYGIYKLSQRLDYYGGHSNGDNDKALGALVTEACQKAAADGVSFKPFDTNDDDYCDVVIVIYAGLSEAQASTTHPEAIWPCNWNLSSAAYYGQGGNGAFRPSNGDPLVDTFAVFNELHGDDDNTTTIDGIGTFAHEFGHCLGLPDFYDTDYGGHYGMGYWDIMCSGCYNNSTYTPIGYSAYEKVFMGWINYITPQPGTYYILPTWNLKSAATDKAVCITSNLNQNEYFIFEYRRKQGWDRYIDGEGILVTHITYNQERWWYNTPNNEDIQLVTYLPADNNFSYYNEDTDLWPQDNKNAVTDNSTPATRLYMRSNGSITGNAGYLGKPVTEIVINGDGTAGFWYMRSSVTTPTIFPSTDTIDFGNVKLGETLTLPLSIHCNNLTQQVQFALSEAMAEPFEVNTDIVSAADANNGAQVQVTFTPQEYGEYMTSLLLSSNGAQTKTIILKGRGIVNGETPVMQPADPLYIDLTKFRADWTDQTSAENVASYTLEVKSKPLYELLETADFSDIPDALTEDGNNFVEISENYERYLPAGWTCTSYIYAYEGALIIGYGGSIKSTNYNFTGYDKVTVVLNARTYYASYYGTSIVEVGTSMGSQEVTLGDDYATQMIVLDCADFDNVTIQANEVWANVRCVEIYAGDLSETMLNAHEEGGTSYRLITGITDKFYTVNDLEAGGTFIYKVKAMYIDGTESPWSNVEQVTLYENAHTLNFGDVNHDGIVNVTDATLLIAYLLGSDNGICPICSDVNEDDYINVTDATRLISILLSSDQ